MPTVPQYQRQSISTELPGARAQASSDINAYGGNVAGQVSQFGKVLDERAQVMQDKLDNSAVLDFTTSANNYFNTYLNDPEKGALLKRGKDAIGLTDQFTKDFTQYMNEAEKKLTNNTQREKFKAFNAGLRDSLWNKVSVYEAKEHQVYNEQTTDGLIESGIKMSVANAYDMNISDNQKNMMFAALDSTYGYKGKVWLDNEKTKITSSIGVGKVGQMIADNNMTALREYWPKAEAFIDPTVKPKIKQQVEGALFYDDAAGLSKAMFAKYGYDTAAASEEIRKKIGGERGERFVQWHDRNVTEMRQEEKRQDTQRLKGVENAVLSAPNYNEALKLSAQLAKDPTEKLKLDDLAKKRFEKDIDRTSSDVYNELSKLAIKGELTEDIVLQYRDANKLTLPDSNRLIGKIQDTSQKQEKDKAADRIYHDKAEVIFKGKYSKKEDYDSNMADFNILVQTQNLKGEEIQAAAQNWVDKDVSKGWWERTTNETQSFRSTEMNRAYQIGEYKMQFGNDVVDNLRTNMKRTGDYQDEGTTIWAINQIDFNANPILLKTAKQWIAQGRPDLITVNNLLNVKSQFEARQQQGG
jgi:hypothetical protein